MIAFDSPQRRLKLIAQGAMHGVVIKGCILYWCACGCT